MSPVIDTRDDDGREQGIRAAVEAVRAGQLVVVPTDTVYGVGADAFDEAAVADLLEAKGRGREMPPPVLVPSPRTIDGLAVGIPLYARRLIDHYWPGALTLVVRAQASLMWDLGETNGTVAVRMPDQPLTLALLSETGPLAVTSANRTGQPPARTVADAASQLGAHVAVYLDAGPSGDGEASTIVDCTGDAPVVLRQGAIPESDILAVVRSERPANDDEVDDDEVDDGPSESDGVETPPHSSSTDGRQGDDGLETPLGSSSMDDGESGADGVETSRRSSSTSEGDSGAEGAVTEPAEDGAQYGAPQASDAPHATDDHARRSDG